MLKKEKPKWNNFIHSGKVIDTQKKNALLEMGKKEINTNSNNNVIWFWNKNK